LQFIHRLSSPPFKGGLIVRFEAGKNFICRNAGAAFHAFPNFLAVFLKLDLAQPLPTFHQAQRLAHNFAGAGVAPGFDLATDELLEMVADGMAIPPCGLAFSIINF
jgi:hypothetical protein